MRILMVCPSYPPQEVTCGVGDYTRCLAEELQRQGAEISVLCSAAYRGSGEGPVRVVPLVRHWTLGEAWRTLAAPPGPPPDVVHLQYTPELYGRGGGFRALPLLARLRRQRPVTLVTFHTLTDGSAWSKVWAVLLLASADHSISANEEVTAMVRRRLPALSRRLREIPIGSNLLPPAADGASRGAARGALGVPDEAPLLAHFGLIYPGKGLETLLHALAELRPRYPGLRLVVVGDTPPESRGYRAGLEALANRLGVDAALLWAGRCAGEEASRILRAADLYVVPFDGGASLRRGTLMAGLAHGLPVVSTAPAPMSAYLKDGTNVALVPARDPRRLAARIAALLAAPDEAARLGREALRLAERFAWPHIARETRELYAEALQA